MSERFGEAGRLLWDEVTAGYSLREDEREALAGACAMLDELSRLEDALAGAPTVVEGSQGQPRVNPLFGEVRAHRLALSRLLGLVGLAEADAARLGELRSDAGRKLARRRWERRGA